MRFLADENVSRLVVERLRGGGHDVMFIAETQSGAPDEEFCGRQTPMAAF